jgi:hypothetical protein
MTLHDTPSATSVDLPETAAGTDGAGNGSGNGNGYSGGVRPPAKPFNMRMAMIVPALGLLILVVFITAEFLTSNPVQPVSTKKATTKVAGTSLLGVPADVALQPIAVAGEPPGNIINAVALPKGFVEVSHVNNSQGADQYDAQVNLTVDTTQGALYSFFKSEMRHDGWALFDEGPAANDPGAIEVLGKQAGSDGFFWEMGAVVSQTTFGNGAPATGTTSFTVRLFQIPDPD